MNKLLLILTLFINAQISGQKVFGEKKPRVIELEKSDSFTDKLSNYSKVIYSKVRSNPDIFQLVDSKKSWTTCFILIDNKWYLNFIAQGSSKLEEASRHLDVKLNKPRNNFYTGLILYRQLVEFLSLNDLEYLEFGIPVKKQLSSARSETGVDDVHKGGSTYGSSKKGEGVIIGVVDMGFDYTHPTFLDSSGKTLRISHVWDQLHSGKSNLSYGYGIEYKTQKDIYDAEHDQHSGSHGTHVMGIAGGSSYGNSNTYLGVAPKSELIAISTSGNHVGVLEGIDYVFSKADSLNKPAVVNLSLGTHIGPHDGSSLFDYYLDALITNSRIVVGAAGNEGQDSLHIQKKFTSTDTVMYAFISFKNSTLANSGNSILDIWGEKNNDFKVSINLVNLSKGTYEDYTPYYNASTSNSSINWTLLDSDNIPDSAFINGSTGINGLNGKPNVIFDIDHGQSDDDQWIMLEIIAKSGKIDAWLNSGIFTNVSGYNSSPFLYGNTDYTVGEIGGTSKQIITVGAYTNTNSYKNLSGSTINIPAYANVGEIAPFSSLGPTADNRVKPDITAPGNVIMSSVSSYDNNYDYYSDNVVGGATNGSKSWYYAAMEGTSMATPFTAGVVALMLETYPDMSNNMVKKVLNSNSKTDSYTGTISSKGSNIWGFGKINAKNIISNMIQDIPQQPILNHTSDTINVCSGDTVFLHLVNLAKNITSIEWNNGSSDDTLTITKNGNYKVKVRSSQGYWSNYSKLITVIFHSKLTPLINSNKLVKICAGDSITLTADSTHKSFKFKWLKNNSELTNTNQSSFTAKDNGAYKLILITQFGCTDTSTPIELIVQSNPKLSLKDTVPSSICESDSYSAFVIDSNNVTIDFSWYVNGIKTSNNTNISKISGNTNFYVLGFSDIGCNSSTDTFKIVEVKDPFVSVNNNGNINICDGDSIKLSFSGKTEKFSWVSNNIPISSDTSIFAKSEGTYFVIGSNSNLCFDTSNLIQVTLLEKPTAELKISGDSVFCQGQSVDVKLITNMGSVNYLFTNSVRGNQTSDTLFKITKSGKYSIQTIETKNSCSSITKSINVTVLDSVYIDKINGEQLVNTGQNYNYSVPDNTETTFTWNIENGKIISGLGTNEVNVVWEAFENGNIWVLQDNGYCNDSQSLAVNTTLSNYSNKTSSLKIYPNPLENSQLFINSDMKIKSISFTDMIGRKMNSNKKYLSDYHVEINLAVSSGEYLIEIEYENHTKHIEKIMVK